MIAMLDESRTTGAAIRGLPYSANQTASVWATIGNIVNGSDGYNANLIMFKILG